MVYALRTVAVILLALLLCPTNSAQADEFDVVVYGGTSAGVTAAVQAARMGKTVALVCPENHLGGLSSSGLGFTDTGKKQVIGGLAREFYHRLWKHYQQPDSWNWEARENYGNRGQGTEALDSVNRTMWIFEPHAAEAAFEQMLAEQPVHVFRDHWLDRESGVEIQGPRIHSIRMLNGKQFEGKMFIDATYEGDLMAAAGVTYHVGRESNDTYGEQHNGTQYGVFHHKHYFEVKIDPYKTPGDPSSGLLARIADSGPTPNGEADRLIQAYCYRLCLTNHPENRVSFSKPDGYDPQQYELLARLLQAMPNVSLMTYSFVPNRKTDTNNNGPFSTDNIGYNYDYPEASYEQRKAILDEHEQYQRGLLYFLTNDPRVPNHVRKKVSSFGLAGDEFTDNDNWPYQIYVREARRMIGEYVMTESDCLSKVQTPQSIGMGSYTMDSHNVQRYITSSGVVQNEGDIGVRLPRPYQVAFKSITPKAEECQNLLVPVCVSSSHIAFGSIRMEPVFMVLGQSAATAAVLSIDSGTTVQEVDFQTLKQRLVADGQVLELPQ
ncbi:FAD-dependent oxidoreductase [Aeoliella sp.]|uniref:FAD-dependent oxidoreductase n=1 Tax=Aeoliella sp. TaxID=2795800 RepID=UPI003CCBD861